MSATKNKCSSAMAFVLIDIQCVSTIKTDDETVGRMAQGAACCCRCDVCTAFCELASWARASYMQQEFAFEELGRFYKAKVRRTKNRCFRYRVLTSIKKAIEGYRRAQTWSNKLSRECLLVDWESIPYFGMSADGKRDPR